MSPVTTELLIDRALPLVRLDDKDDGNSYQHITVNQEYPFSYTKVGYKNGKMKYATTDGYTFVQFLPLEITLD